MNTQTQNNWNDFNDAEAQMGGFELIPRGAIVPLRMTIKPGGYDDPTQGWSGGYASESFDTGSVYLSCEFVVTAGPFAKRKMWSNVGLHSKKGPTWAQMGRSFIRAALNSARGVHPQDNSAQAVNARRIASFADLDGIEFIARVDVEKDNKGEDRNIVKVAIEPDHKDYAALRSSNSATTTPAPASLAASVLAAQPAMTGKPSWAQ